MKELQTTTLIVDGLTWRMVNDLRVLFRPITYGLPLADDDKVYTRGMYTGDKFDNGANLTVLSEFVPAVKAYLNLFNTYVEEMGRDGDLNTIRFL